MVQISEANKVQETKLLEVMLPPKHKKLADNGEDVD